jgi:hypothetical protein
MKHITKSYVDFMIGADSLFSIFAACLGASFLITSIVIICMNFRVTRRGR